MFYLNKIEFKTLVDENVVFNIEININIVSLSAISDLYKFEIQILTKLKDSR